MRKTTTINVLFTLLLAGCVSNEKSDKDVISGEGSIASNLINYTEFSGKAHLNQTQVCLPDNDGVICAGSVNRNFHDGFYVTKDMEKVFVTAKWNSTNPALQNLEMLIYSGEYPSDYILVVRDQGDSPLTLSFSREDLFGHPTGSRLRLGVGFTGEGPIRATSEQTIYWDAFVFTP